MWWAGGYGWMLIKLQLPCLTDIYYDNKGRRVGGQRNATARHATPSNKQATNQPTQSSQGSLIPIFPSYLIRNRKQTLINQLTLPIIINTLYIYSLGIGIIIVCRALVLLPPTSQPIPILFVSKSSFVFVFLPGCVILI